jgi:hypothetical protein
MTMFYIAKVAGYRHDDTSCYVTHQGAQDSSAQPFQVQMDLAGTALRAASLRADLAAEALSLRLGVTSPTPRPPASGPARLGSPEGSTACKCH